MTSFEIPKSGSEWLYSNHRVRVVSTIVRWEYVHPTERERGEQPYSCEAYFWHSTFTPAPVDPKPGETYRSERYEFYVYELVTDHEGVQVFGRERYTEAAKAHPDDERDWWPESYPLKRFQKDFKKVEDEPTTD